MCDIHTGNRLTERMCRPTKLKKKIKSMKQLISMFSHLLVAASIRNMQYAMQSIYITNEAPIHLKLMSIKFDSIRTPNAH